jgi:hypothetical protein
MPNEEEPQLSVTHPLSPGELADLGPAPHPDEPPTQPTVPIEEPTSYTILINAPKGELIAFSDEEGRHTPDDYNKAQFFLGPEGRGTFTFMPSATEISIEGSGTRTADEDRVNFENAERGLSGVFSFPRGGHRGEVTLTHGSARLKAAAIQGVVID